MPRADLAPEWRGLRARRLGCAITLIVVFVFWIAMGFIVDYGSTIVFFLVSGVGAAAMIVALERLRRWPCPRCNRPFSVRSVRSRELPLAKACRHCGLPQFAELPSPSPSSSERRG